jgi:hypothetical protein
LSLAVYSTYINYLSSIIQDCEDALTNWVSQNAAVSAKLSTRARTLSQRRKNHRQEGLDLSHQDQPMIENRESGMWVPAAEHRDDQYDDEEDEYAESTVANGESRGREEERVVV